MKKFLALTLALLMVFSLVACGNGEAEKTNPPASQPGTTNTDAPQNTEPTGPAQGEEIPYTPLIHLDFETADGLKAVRQGNKGGDPNLDPGAKELLDSVHDILIAKDYGAVGSSLMLDGKYGVRVENMPKTSDDTYTIAFWYAADRYSQYGPILQIGSNVGCTEHVTWINFTKADTWAIGGEEAAPVAWNRNSDEDVWPWVGNNIDLKGKREWVHLALVVDGNAYKSEDGKNKVAAQFYVNGVLVMEASAADVGLVDEAGLPIDNNWKGVSPNILTSEGVYGIECLLGVNYWDQYSKEYIDEFYLYDEALTAGQVATLYSLGNPPAYQTMPAYEGPTDEEIPEPEPPALPEITPNPDAIDTIGAITRDNGFWTDTSDGFEIKDGGSITMKFHNYSDAANVWNNPVFAYSNTAVTTDKIAGAGDFPGYAEYGVTRVDGIAGAAWGDGTGTFDKSWPDDATFMEVMKDAEVTAVFSRAVNVITVNVTIVGADGTSFTETITFTANNMAADAPCYVHITNEHCYIELLSVE